MKPYKVEIMGEGFSLLSESRKMQYTECPLGPTAILSPTGEADFSVSWRDNGKNPGMDAYSAAACAAAFLIGQCGLPMDEISFNSCGKIVKIFNTGRGIMSVEMPKCKFKFTKSDLDFDSEIQMVKSAEHQGIFLLRCESVENFDFSLAPLLLMRSGQDPIGTFLSFGINGDECVAKSYTAHLEYPPARLLLALLISSYLLCCSVSVKRILIDGQEAYLSDHFGTSCLSFHIF